MEATVRISEARWGCSTCVSAMRRMRLTKKATMRMRTKAAARMTNICGRSLWMKESPSRCQWWTTSVKVVSSCTRSVKRNMMMTSPVILGALVLALESVSRGLVGWMRRIGFPDGGRHAQFCGRTRLRIHSHEKRLLATKRITEITEQKREHRGCHFRVVIFEGWHGGCGRSRSYRSGGKGR